MPQQKIDILNLQKEFNRPLILDGAMGSLLTSDEINHDKWLWSSMANINNPQSVLEAHRAYIEAGADIITTNTFRTNPTALGSSSYKISNEELVHKSVELAIRSREDRPVAIAGSNAPAEDCYQTERTINLSKLDYNHKKHIELLYESEVDFILSETQSHWDEIEIVTKFCSYNQIPFVVSFFFTEDLKLLSGEPLSEAIEFVTDHSPLAISFNCIGFSEFNKLITHTLPKTDWGFYINCGGGNYTDETITCGIKPKDYLENIKNIIEFKPLFTGACCGSSPEHIKFIKEYFDEIY